MIVVDDGGKPYVRPDRSEFEDGIEGTIAFMRAMNVYRDRIADDANRVFDDVFRRSVAKKS